MQRRAFTARLKPEARDAYVAAHKSFWPELREHYRQAGIASCSVYLLENQLFLYVEAADYEAMQAILDRDPLDLAWGKVMDPMLEPGGYQPMTEVFHLE